ncbi:hypothetical protein PROFUN_08273 [Planoprotostelium fungivorum]|uniref:Sister chromatid cohesion protein n=1 Tax=Planoprotostelium fungivorum TaxID=1890364 RepID=A0A2P6NJW8_9EUKA|nr:hypothetical protein PROFUN_08273 [Planoprotostelium fungivorum]
MEGHPHFNPVHLQQFIELTDAQNHNQQMPPYQMQQQYQLMQQQYQNHLYQQNQQLHRQEMEAQRQMEYQMLQQQQRQYQMQQWPQYAQYQQQYRPQMPEPQLAQFQNRVRNPSIISFTDTKKVLAPREPTNVFRTNQMEYPPQKMSNTMPPHMNQIKMPNPALIVQQVVPPVHQTEEERLQSMIEKYTEFLSQEEGDQKENHPYGFEGRTHDVLQKLSVEINKMKAMKTIQKLSTETLTSLVEALHAKIKAKSESIIDFEREKETHFGPISALEASLIALNISVTPNISRTVFSEEVLDTILDTARFQLEKNIYKQCDPTYGLEEGEGEKKKAKKKGKYPLLMFHTLEKFCELLEKLNEFMTDRTMTDNVVLHITNITLPTFFVEGTGSLLLPSLTVVRSIFSKYVSHRVMILEEIFNSMTVLPKSKRQRQYELSDDSHTVQMLTALVIQLIQSCTGMDRSKENNYSGAVSCANAFVTYFIKQCTLKNAEADYKQILESFVGDVKSLLNLPEWPAAELFLQILCSSLSGILAKQDSPALRPLALELLGGILTKMKSECNQIGEEKVLDESVMEEPEEKEEEIKDEKEEEIKDEKEEEIKDEKVVVSGASGIEDDRCLCGRGDDGSLMIDCDKCHNWFHAACVGIPDIDQVPSVWNCPSCRVVDKKEVIKDEELARRDVILRYLAAHSKKDGSNIFSRQFFISQWLDQDDSCGASLDTLQGRKDYYSRNWKVEGRPSIVPRKEEVMEIIRRAAMKRPLFKNVDNIMKQLLAAMSESQANIRSKAIKSMTATIEVDPTLLGDEGVQKAMHARFSDPSISVRDSIVDLVGRFISTNPEYVPQYYTMIAERILDVGISVRKRVIKILCDLCLRDPCGPIVSEICCKLVASLNDEENIKEVITKSLQELWFSDKRNADVRYRVLLIMDVVRSTTNHEWLEQLLNAMYARDKNFSVTCQKMCDAMVEICVSIEEKQIVHDKLKASVVTGFTTLALFCAVDPRVMLNHINILHSHLNNPANTKEEATVILHAANMLGQVVPLSDDLQCEQVIQIVSDLKDALSSHGTMVLQSCAKSLCSISTASPDFIGVMEETYVKYYTLGQSQSRDPPSAQMPVIMRAILVLSLVCRHFDYESISSEKIQSVIKADKTPVEAALHMFSSFSKWNSHDLRGSAYQGICQLLIRKPSLLAQPLSQGLVTKGFSSNEAKIKYQLVKCFADLLTEEDKRIKSLSHTENTRGGLDHGMVQPFLPEILKSLYDKAPTVRQAALQTATLICRHGLSNPTDIIPCTIALCTDRSQGTTTKAMALLTFIAEKHSNFLQLRFCDGLRESYEFQKKSYPSAFINSTGTGQAEPFMSPVYQLFKPKSKYHVLQSVLRNFEDENKDKLPYLKYVTETLATLPYATEDEVLFVIYHTNRLISLHSSPVQQYIKSVVKDNPTPPMNTQLKEQTVSMARLSFLLLLKSTLKNYYSLTDTKCISFVPGNRPEKSFVKQPDLITFNEISSPFSVVHLDPGSSQIKSQFEQFNQMLKGDGMDYNTTAKVTNKRGAKRKTAEPKEKKKPTKRQTKKGKKKAKEEEEEEEAMMNPGESDLRGCMGCQPEKTMRNSGKVGRFFVVLRYFCEEHKQHVEPQTNITLTNIAQADTRIFDTQTNDMVLVDKRCEESWEDVKSWGRNQTRKSVDRLPRPTYDSNINFSKTNYITRSGSWDSPKTTQMQPTSNQREQEKSYEPVISREYTPTDNTLTGRRPVSRAELERQMQR